MQAFLILSGSSPLLVPEFERLLEDLPFVPDHIDVWNSPCGTLHSCFFSQASTLFPARSMIHSDRNGHTGFVGYLWPSHGTFDRMHTAARLRSEIIKHNIRFVRSRLQGQFLIVHSEQDRAQIIPDPMNTETGFYGVRGPIAAFSNRIGLIQSALELDDDLDLLAASHHVAWGVLPDGVTPFKNIHALNVGSVYNLHRGCIDERIISPHPLRDIPHDAVIDVEDDRYWHGVITRLQRNVEFLKDKQIWGELGLSGGKDSRLVLAILQSAELDHAVHIFTNGDKAHPDVVVAGTLTDHFGIFHEIRTPQAIAPMESARLLDGIFPSYLALNEGMHSVWDARGRGQRDDRIVLSGLNGEWFRSSFDSHGKDTAWVKTLDDAKRFLIKELWLDPGDLLINEVNDAHRQWRLSWLSRFSERGMEPSDAPNLFYVLNQSSRRNANTKRFGAWFHYRVDVLLSNDLLSLAFMQGSADRRDERIHYELLKRLSPWMASQPFAKDSWRKRWSEDRREPIRALDTLHGLKSHRHWRERINFDTEYRSMLRSRLLDRGTHDSLFSIVSRSRLESLLNKTQLAFHERLSLYGVLTIALLLEPSRKAQVISKNSTRPGTIVREEGTQRAYRILRGRKKCIDNSEVSVKNRSTISANMLSRLDTD